MILVTNQYSSTQLRKMKSFLQNLTLLQKPIISLFSITPLRALQSLASLWISLSLTLPLSACGDPEQPEPPTTDPTLVAACSYIRGGGADATGGEGGAIYFVTRLDDEIDPSTGKAEEGTLRYAVEEGEPRVVLFRIAGTIHLSKPLVIRKGNITIAGQSAPGDGICIADYPLQVNGADNVIIRFIRVRLGNESLKEDPSKDYDAVSVNDASHVVLDHLSCSWSVDECVSCYGNTDFTLQYCFITESLRNAGHTKGAHGYGGIWGGERASFHHNLIAHHDSRNPRFCHDYVNNLAGPIDYVCNVVYNWGGNSTYGGEGTTAGGGGRKVNFVGNYYRPGPSTKSSVRARLCNPTTTCSNCTAKYPGEVLPMQLYLMGNIMDGSDEVTADNWKGIHPDQSDKLDLCRAAESFSFPNSLLAGNTESASEALEVVAEKGGCSLVRDAVDKRIVSDLQSGSGSLIDTPDQVGGWPELKGEPAIDTDRDGIPDEWEEAHGLNPRSFADHKAQTLVPGHTNLEVYLCDIVKHLY